MNVKLNNKGFTLIELLAVIVILISVSLVAVGGISASLKDRDVKECQEQKELAIGSAKIYFSLNSDKDPFVGVKVGDLKTGNYLSSENNNVSRLTDDGEIKLVKNDEGYVYEYTGDCVE